MGKAASFPDNLHRLDMEACSPTVFSDQDSSDRQDAAWGAGRRTDLCQAVAWMTAWSALDTFVIRS
jgi:hypothetical protein